MIEKFRPHRIPGQRKGGPSEFVGSAPQESQARMQRRVVGMLEVLRERMRMAEGKFVGESWPLSHAAPQVHLLHEAASFAHRKYRHVIGSSSHMPDQAHGRMRQFATEYASLLEGISHSLPSVEYAQQLFLGNIPLPTANLEYYSPGILDVLIKNFDELNGAYNKGSYIPILSTIVNGAPVQTIRKSLQEKEEAYAKELDAEGNRYVLAKALFTLLPHLKVPPGTTAKDLQSQLSLTDNLRFEVGKYLDAVVKVDESTGQVSVGLESIVHKDNMSMSFHGEKVRVVDAGHLADIDNGKNIAWMLWKFLPLGDTETVAKVRTMLQEDRNEAAAELAQYRQKLVIPRLLIHAARSVSKEPLTKTATRVDRYKATELLRKASGLDSVDLQVDPYSLRELLEQNSNTNWLSILFQIQQHAGQFPKYIADQIQTHYDKLSPEQREYRGADGGREYFYVSPRGSVVRFHMQNEFDREIILAPASVRDDAIAKLGGDVYDIAVSSKNMISSDKTEGHMILSLSGVNNKGETKTVTIRRKLPQEEVADLGKLFSS